MAKKKQKRKRPIPLPPKVKDIPKPTVEDAQASAEDIHKRAIANLDSCYKLDNVDVAIIRVMMQFPGLGVDGIAKAIGYTRQWIYERTARPGFKSALAELAKSVMDLLVEGQQEAIRRLKKECANLDPVIAIAAAKALLAPLNHANTQPAAAVQQNLLFAVQFGENGQMFQSCRLMKPEEQFVDPRQFLDN